jgi:hypothetical protein
VSDIPRNVPPGNEPGHHPQVEQDKPSGPPPGPPRRFPLAFEPAFRLVDRALGVTEDRAYVEVDRHHLRVRFGPWSAEVPRDDVAAVDVTGPYHLAKVLGPPHLSLADRGVTFATNRRRGVCIRLSRPVPAIEPLGLLRHPSITVTVEDPDALVEALAA